MYGVMCAALLYYAFAHTVVALSFFLRYPNECQFDVMAGGGGMMAGMSTCGAAATVGCNATTAALFTPAAEAFLKSKAALSGKGRTILLMVY